MHGPWGARWPILAPFVNGPAADGGHGNSPIPDDNSIRHEPNRRALSTTPTRNNHGMPPLPASV